MSLLKILGLTLVLGVQPVMAAETTSYQLATFAGGCFWCVQEAFDGVPGVVEVLSGYTGGQREDPTYEEVTQGGTGHAEAVQVKFDPQKISYAKLLAIFWRNIDPTVTNRQFCDVGTQYRTVIFYHNEEQKRLAEESKQTLLSDKRFEHVATEVVPASAFYVAEKYHQYYYKKNAIRYKLYRYGCGRDQRLDELWGEK